MKWVRRLIANFGHMPRVAKTPVEPPSVQSQALIDDAKSLRSDLKALKRFELIVRRK